MNYLNNLFANIYYNTIKDLHSNITTINCRNQQISYEIINYHCSINMKYGISIYSHINSRAIPITFVLGEFLWIIGGHNEIKLLEKFNKSMLQYSDDGEILNGAYGPRIMPMLQKCIQKLINDKYTRQAFIPIFYTNDLCINTLDVPCNTSLQFLIRKDYLNLIITSRSSDFITGFSIDSLHWQMLFFLILDILKNYYSTLKPGFIHYNIASLHVYKRDKLIFNEWNASNNFSWVLPFENIKLNKIQEFISHYFNHATTLEDLIKIFQFNMKQQLIIKNLQNVFINRIYKINRN